MENKTVNRRTFIKGLGIGSAAVGTGFMPIGCRVPSAETTEGEIQDDGPVLEIGDNIAVANTDCGKVKGFVVRGVYTFLGIPYGADTSGENRFMPPKKHAA